MKRALYGIGSLALVFILIYANIEKIANWWVRNDKDPTANELPYFKNQYIITFPKDSISAQKLREFLLSKNLRLLPNGRCSCKARIELWGSDMDVAINPETDPPGGPMGLAFIQPPPAVRGITSPQQNAVVQATGQNIARNYRINEWLPKEIIRKYAKPLALPKIFFKPLNPEVKIAIIDTGVDPEVEVLEPWLNKNTAGTNICMPPAKEGVYGFNYLNSTNSLTDLEPLDKDGQGCGILFRLFNYYKLGHGTLINSIIAGLAQYPNSGTVNRDTTVNLKMINVKFIEKRANDTDDRTNGKGSLFHALCAMYYGLDKGATVLNASWNIAPLTADIRSARNAFVDVLAEIRNKNAILVTSAGNNGIKNDANLRIWPASFSNDTDFPVFNEHVIAVGASNNNQITAFSNEGNFVDVYAPGYDISAPAVYQHYFPSYSCLNLYKSQNGSSFSVPFITREVAIRKGQNASPANIKSAMRSLTATQQAARPGSPVQNLRIFAPYQ